MHEVVFKYVNQLLCVCVISCLSRVESKGTFLPMLLPLYFPMCDQGPSR